MLPRWGSVAFYLILGWVALIPLPEMLRLLPLARHRADVPWRRVYSVGAVIYARRRPNPFPRVFGFHEVFHLFVIAGSASFFYVVWTWVVPFPRV